MAKSSLPSRKISRVIRERGPLTVAAFVDLALYDPELGYYARAARRSGRAGDFFTSVDIGPLFGELLSVEVAEMAEILSRSAQQAGCAAGGSFTLVEAGAGDGRLSADLLRELKRSHSSLYARTRLHLVERSTAARAAQAHTLADVGDRLASASDRLPDRFDGVLLANELLDALPVHQVVMREGGLREIYVSACPQSDDLTTVEGPPSTPALASYLEHVGVALESGWRAEISLEAVSWIRDAARRLGRGFIILLDYGHEARELYSATHSSGTLTAFAQQMLAGAESSRLVWLLNPGEQDITAHVDFTSVRAAAEAEGCVTLGFLDQTYFLLALVGSEGSRGSTDLGSLNVSNPSNLSNPSKLSKLSDRLALKTLIMPGGLGSTMKVLIFGKGVGRPTLAGCSDRMRVT